MTLQTWICNCGYSIEVESDKYGVPVCQQHPHRSMNITSNKEIVSARIISRKTSVKINDGVHMHINGEHAELRDTLNGTAFQIIAGPRKGEGNVEFKDDIVSAALAVLTTMFPTNDQ